MLSTPPRLDACAELSPIAYAVFRTKPGDRANALRAAEASIVSRPPGAGSERNSSLDMALTSAQTEHFRALLTEKRNSLVEAAKSTLDSEMVLSPDDRFDEVDQASSEYMQEFSFRLRGRERHLIEKIDVALRKMDEGIFGVCDECEEAISFKRLSARPEAPLCIQCKESQEKEEAVYADE